MNDLISKMLERYESGRISRRDLVRSLALLAAAAPPRPAPAATFRGLELNHLALDVGDVGRSRDFYQKLLGLPVVRESATSCFLGLGRHFLELFRRDRASVDHFAIAIEGFDMRRATQELRRQGVEVDQQRAAERVYFRDPDGLMVQLVSPDHKP